MRRRIRREHDVYNSPEDTLSQFDTDNLPQNLATEEMKSTVLKISTILKIMI